MKKDQRSVTNRFITIAILRRAAARMIPLYTRIAHNRKYAEAWTSALRKGDISQRLLDKIGMSLNDKDIFSFGSTYNSYSVDFEAPYPIVALSNGISMSSNAPKTSFKTSHHQVIAGAILPLYHEISSNQAFARRVVKANKTGNNKLLSRLIRSKVNLEAFRAVQITKTSFQIVFQFGASPVVYYNEFYRGVDF
ncbi:hypothetical protein E0485_05950 [Paenibacillus albiflavus]|uniref:Uncharacterized protein n=1 Tax=Paenibacillus albiflavus TaxID=2545760 RepID=A0A4V2WPH5_9BACL|nr:hypothetical protein [Paenibacillus albiflavus]TCZ79402.1 hypothetical protein E0485_05950 [Paenibacillus albiflavus]